MSRSRTQSLFLRAEPLSARLPVCLSGFALVALVLTSCVAPTVQVAPPASQTTVTSLASTSLPPAPEVPGALLVIGDWGSGSQSEQEVAEALRLYSGKHPVRAILTTGDNFYNNDAERLMAPYDWAEQAGIPFWVTWGNHDVESTSRIVTVNGAFDSPPRWTAHDWGSFKVVILDSNQVANPEQLTFLKAKLAADGRPTIVTFHHPAYSCSRHGDTKDVLTTWLPLFGKDVVLVLNGHDHNYQRFEAAGISYVVTGGGGRSIYETSTCPANHPASLSASASYHFLALSQTGGLARVEVIASDGEQLDSFALGG